jgi:hypothetical protein
LDEDVELGPVLIHRTPERVPLALDADKDLIQLPFVSWLGSPPTQAAGEALTERSAPTRDRVVAEEAATFGQELLHIPQAQAEHVIQPNRLADNLRGGAMAAMRVG